MKHRKHLLIAVVLLAVTLSACGGMFAAPEPVEQVAGEGESGALGDVDSNLNAAPTSSPRVEAEMPAEESMAEPADGMAMGGEAMEESAPAPGAREDDASEFAAGGGGDVAGSGDEVFPSEGNPVYTPPDQQFAPLQAGEIDDNEEFGGYLQYRLDFQKFLGYPVSDRDISERHIIQVTTQNGSPVLGAEVLVYDGQRLVTALRTTATGTAYFFPRAYGANGATFSVDVSKGQSSTNFTISREQTNMTWPVTLNVQPTRPPVQLDVVFLIDATGSMSDEISQLKDNILSISAQIEALPGDPDVRFGLVHYRDRGDSYVVRSSDFTGNVQRFQRDLQQVSAGGGGDDPESMNEALHVAVNQMSWRVENTVSLVFLVADAPPHLDYSQDYDYAATMMNAAELGIKIFPIGSRLDGNGQYQQQAEYIFRQIAQFTGGNFIFLTYEDTPQSSGEPGTEYNVSEDSYSVEDLDALVVRLIRDELEALTGQ